MASVKIQRYCKYCQRYTLAERPLAVSGGMGCLLTILTAGLFLPLWIVMAVYYWLFKPYRCHACGTAVF
jgi:hypothetical protein